MDLGQDIKHLFSEWIEAEYKQLVRRSAPNASTYARALRSIRECETPLRHPDQLPSLKYIGDKMAAKMAKKLQRYCDENGYKYPEATAEESEEHEDEPAKKRKKPAKKPAKKRKYIPGRNSGGYAILVALLSHDRNREGLKKDDVIRYATPHCSTSLVPNPTSGNFYSGWSSVNTLIKHGYVIEQGRPKYYYLTDEGEEIAKHLAGAAAMGEDDGAGDGGAEGGQSEGSGYGCGCGSGGGSTVSLHGINVDLAAEKYHGVHYRRWPAGSYEILFVSDNREVRSKQERGFFAEQLRVRGVDADSCALAVGDGVWVAANKETNQWAVLDFIFERKRLDDLAASIKDGRFREQKTRLERTGLRRIIYLIEEQMSNDVSRFSEALQTCMAMAITYSNFHLKKTKSSDDTVRYLLRLDKEVKQYYRDKDLVVMEPRNLASQADYHSLLREFRHHFKSEAVYNFETFQGVMSKTNMTTVAEMFIRLLMTVRGVSLDKATQIQRQFHTPSELLEALNAAGASETLLYEKFKQEVGVHRIGPALSSKIYETWGS